jgi:hypothetical protein
MMKRAYSLTIACVVLLGLIGPTTAQQSPKVPDNVELLRNVAFDNIAVLRVNRKTGGLTFAGHYTPVGNPSIIVFLDLAKE